MGHVRWGFSLATWNHLLLAAALLPVALFGVYEVQRRLTRLGLAADGPDALAVLVLALSSVVVFSLLVGRYVSRHAAPLGLLRRALMAMAAGRNQEAIVPTPALEALLRIEESLSQALKAEVVDGPKADLQAETQRRRDEAAKRLAAIAHRPLPPAAQVAFAATWPFEADALQQASGWTYNAHRAIAWLAEPAGDAMHTACRRASLVLLADRLLRRPESGENGAVAEWAPLVTAPAADAVSVCLDFDARSGVLCYAARQPIEALRLSASGAVTGVTLADTTPGGAPVQGRQVLDADETWLFTSRAESPDDGTVKEAGFAATLAELAEIVRLPHDHAGQLVALIQGGLAKLGAAQGDMGLIVAFCRPQQTEVPQP